MQVLTIINYTGLYLHQRFSVIKNQEADVFFFLFHDVYIFTQLLANVSESTVAGETCSLVFCCFSSIGLSAPPLC